MSIMNVFIFITDYSYAAWLKLCSYFYRNEKDVNNENLPAVILVPGVYENWFYFRKIQSLLIRHGYNVIIADSIYQSESLEKDSEALSTYIYRNSLENVTLIGHSSGGITALKTLSKNRSINKIIAIAAPFSGVNNGHFLRTVFVRELLPNAHEILEIKALPKALLEKVISIYPAYDNQIWSKSGSILDGAKNVQLKSKGHHLILNSDELMVELLSVLNS